MTSAGGTLSDGLTVFAPGPPPSSLVTWPSVNGMYCSMFGKIAYQSSAAAAATSSSEPASFPPRPNGSRRQIHPYTSAPHDRGPLVVRGDLGRVEHRVDDQPLVVV